MSDVAPVRAGDEVNMDDPRVRAAFESAIRQLPPSACALHTQQLDRIEKRLERFEEALVGNGHPGIKTRIDRLEQSAESAKWLGRATFGTALAAIVAAFGRLIWK
jgi:hypothetical protein